MHAAQYGGYADFRGLRTCEFLGSPQTLSSASFGELTQLLEVECDEQRNNTNSTTPAKRPFRVPSRTYFSPLLSSAIFGVTRAADADVLHKKGEFLHLGEGALERPEKRSVRETRVT